jgi:hypothetical protein
VLAEALEKIFWRSALLAGEVQSDAGSSLGLRLDAGVADGFREDEGGSVEVQVTMPNWCDNCRVGGALPRDGREADSWASGFFRLHYLCAVVCAVSSAACRQISVGARRDGQYRRNQRKAEEKKQDDAEQTLHNAIVASFACWCVKQVSGSGISPWRRFELDRRQGAWLLFRGCWFGSRALNDQVVVDAEGSRSGVGLDACDG